MREVGFRAEVASSIRRNVSKNGYEKKKGKLTENEDTGIPQPCPCEGQSLLLSTTQRNTAHPSSAKYRLDNSPTNS